MNRPAFYSDQIAFLRQAKSRILPDID
jgi:hypothetical protein